MAPEMMKMMKYDEKVDIFSFGIVLCEVCMINDGVKSIRKNNERDLQIAIQCLIWKKLSENRQIL